MAHAAGNGVKPEAYISPAPIPYPSPAMQPIYAYPQQEQDGGELYRGPQEGNTIVLPPLNLPPIRSIESMQSPYQQQQHHGEGIKLEPLLAPGGPGPNGYYQHDGQPSPYPQQPMHMAQHSQYLGYPQAAQGQDQRMLSGTRHKKEIKRRTKTGCLTCRKRRIKVSKPSAALYMIVLGTGIAISPVLTVVLLLLLLLRFRLNP